jgi:hypothetical protein
MLCKLFIRTHKATLVIGDLGWFWLSRFNFIARKTLNYLSFQSFDLSWWRVFQKLVVRIKLDIYIFIFQLCENVVKKFLASTQERVPGTSSPDDD